MGRLWTNGFWKSRLFEVNQESRLLIESRFLSLFQRKGVGPLSFFAGVDSDLGPKIMLDPG